MTLVIRSCLAALVVLCVAPFCNAKDFPSLSIVWPSFSYPDDLLEDPRSFQGEEKWCLWLNSPKGDFKLFMSPYFYFPGYLMKPHEGMVDYVMREEFGNKPNVHFSAHPGYFHLWQDYQSSDGWYHHRHCYIARGEVSNFGARRLEIDHQGGPGSEGMRRYEEIVRSFVPFVTIDLGE